MTRLFDLSGRTALVTGSAQGLGNAVARGLAEAGATIVLNDVLADRLDGAVARLRADGLVAQAVVRRMIPRGHGKVINMSSVNGGDPSEPVGVAVFLASDASSFVNGQVIYVDGGLLAAL